MILKVLLVIGLKIIEIIAFSMLFFIPYSISLLRNKFLEKKYPDDYDSRLFYIKKDRDGEYILERFFFGLLVIMIMILLLVVVLGLIFFCREWIISNCQLADKILEGRKIII
jgi:hypothetical protein